jgi:hypothetical protein
MSAFGRRSNNMRVEQESTVQTRCASKRESGRRELAPAQASEPAEAGEAEQHHRPGRWFRSVKSKGKADEDLTAIVDAFSRC